MLSIVVLQILRDILSLLHGDPTLSDIYNQLTDFANVGYSTEGD